MLRLRHAACPLLLLATAALARALLRRRRGSGSRRGRRPPSQSGARAQLPPSSTAAAARKSPPPQQQQQALPHVPFPPDAGAESDAVAGALLAGGVLIWADGAGGGVERLRSLRRDAVGAGGVSGPLLVSWREGSDAPFAPSAEAAEALRRNCAAPAAGSPSVELVVMTKNRARRLIEWLAYHAALGVAHVHVYDDNSTDNTRPAAAGLAAAGLVSFAALPPQRPGRGGVGGGEDLRQRQLEVWSDAVRRLQLRHRNSTTRWLGMLDNDEYLLPSRAGCLSALLDPIAARGHLAVYFPWAEVGHRNVTDNGPLRNLTVWEATGFSRGDPRGAKHSCIARHTVSGTCVGLGKSLARLDVLQPSPAGLPWDFPHLPPLRPGLDVAFFSSERIPVRRAVTEGGLPLPIDRQRVVPCAHRVGRQFSGTRMRGNCPACRVVAQCKQAQRDYDNLFGLWGRYYAGEDVFPTVVLHLRTWSLAALVQRAVGYERQSGGQRYQNGSALPLGEIHRQWAQQSGRGFEPLRGAARRIVRRRSNAVRRALGLSGVAAKGSLPEVAAFRGPAARAPLR
eukprot:TRINITY_DN15933_c0_g1_i4.p1 TRINITY_DN15933_c0_g1~~TRINITY_DN15933_c0_g1_i4.p1  ORF type:complete len:592 (+),score=149.24 TRINITY_DN15933_c0_g1_i4:81-1778(+)